MAASRTLGRCALLIAALLLTGVSLAGAADTAVAPETRARVLDQYRVLVIQDGIVLTLRRGESRSIEVSSRGIAVDGTPVSGAELRDRLGADADLVLQLSYASPDALRAAFAPAPSAPAPAPAPSATPPQGEASPATPAPGAATPDVAPVAPPAVPTTPAPERPRRKHSAKINFGGNIVVEEDELITDPVVAIGGNVDVMGHVEDDVVAVGGNVRLGPHAVVDGSITAVGGRVDQEPGAEVRGEVNEITFPHGAHIIGPAAWAGIGHDMFAGWFRFFGTLLRIALVLVLALIFTLIAEGPVERIARRAGDDPWLSGFVGLMLQVLIVPITVVTVVVLAITIIGIPLLVLVPFALVALIVGTVLGFVGVARRVGEWAAPGRGAYVAPVVGVIMIAAVTILARLLWLLPAPIGVIAFIVSVIGFFVEYVAWTVGIGAMLLTRFGTRGPRLSDPVVVVPPIPPVPPTMPIVADPPLRSE